MSDTARQRDWHMVRLKRSTVARLREIGDRFRREYESGRSNVNVNPDTDGISLDRVITELVRRDDEHRERSKRSRMPKDEQQG